MRDDTIHSLDRALQILLTIYENGREMGVSELSEEMGIYKSTVFRTLKTMENRGFIRQNLDNGKYWLGLKLYAIGSFAGEKLHIRDIVAPYTKKLQEEFHEMVNISVLDSPPGEFHRSIIIHKEYMTGQILTVNQPLGSSSLCYCSSVGKCLLAFTPGVDFKIYQDKPMKAFTARTIVTYQDLMKELEQVRAQGYAVDREEQEDGLTCVGAPILDRDGNAIASISISGPTARIGDQDWEENVNKRIDRLKEVTQNIQSQY